MVVGKWYTKKARSYNTSNIKALFCLKLNVLTTYPQEGKAFSCAAGASEKTDVLRRSCHLLT